LTNAEKSFLYLAIFLFALGMVSRLGFLNKLSPLEIISLPMNTDFSEAAPVATEGDSLAVPIDSLNLNEYSKPEETKKPKIQKKKPSFPININTASKEDLCFIKGVGPAMAQKIIDHRESKGEFRTAKDLEKVSGIGAKKRAAMEEFLTF
jgi:competence protein ComEA